MPLDRTTQPNRCRALVRILAGAAAAVVVVLVAAAPADATWSIVATDPETGEVGAAIASCVPAEVLGDLDRPLVPIVLQPGTSAAVTQAQLNLDAPPRIRELTATGATPAEIIEELTVEEFDELAPLRQHAIVSVTGQAAAFTGADNHAEALDAQGDAVSVQGNLLVGPAVVDDALARFEAGLAGGSLADALVAGLVAGSDAGGDRRCDDQTALFAQVVVVESDEDAAAPEMILTVVVDEGDDQNPVALLAAAYENGDRGVIEAGRGEEDSNVFRIVVLLIAVAMFAGGIVAFRKGFGSARARR